jgi:dipeptidyl aminopeptidase/acylaminoacyl peptidase
VHPESKTHRTEWCSRYTAHLSHFSDDGISYESDKNRIFVMKDVTESLSATEFHVPADGKGSWDRSPGAIFWSQYGKTIYTEAEDFARVSLFSLPSDPTRAASPPNLVFKESAVSDVQWLRGDKLLISSNSFIENSLFFSVDPTASTTSNTTSGISLISANLNNGTTFGLSRSQVSEFFYTGAGDYVVHAWIFKPSFFQEGQAYPLVFYIYGSH